MTPFEYLVMTHLISDWLAQTEYQAINKAKGSFLNLAIITHCLIYTLFFLPVFYLLGISWWWLIILFFSHWVLDRRWPEYWFLEKVKGMSRESIVGNHWLVIAVDQIFHLLVLVAVVIWGVR
jgi:hypothetical protein